MRSRSEDCEEKRHGKVHDSVGGGADDSGKRVVERRRRFGEELKVLEKMRAVVTYFLEDSVGHAEAPDWELG